MAIARDIVLGDVHGCIDELNNLLKLVSYRPSDRLVFVGDLVDRGPDSAGVVRRVRELGAECVMGNHDEWYVRCARHERAFLVSGQAHPLQKNAEKYELFKRFSEVDLAWLAQRPYFIRLDDKTAVVHAGFMPGVPLEEQIPHDMLRLRQIDGVSWATRWTGPEDVIYGHHPSRSDAVATRNGDVTCWGIDTGCCFGNKLTAWVRANNFVQLVSVPARKTYAEWHETMRETL